MSTVSKIRQSDVLLYALPTAWLRSQELETQQKRQPRRENLERDQAPRRETVR